jgi:hypothetical protein
MVDRFMFQLISGWKQPHLLAPVKQPPRWTRRMGHLSAAPGSISVEWLGRRRISDLLQCLGGVWRARKWRPSKL